MITYSSPHIRVKEVAGGFSPQELEQHQPDLERVYAAIQEQKKHDKLGFVSLLSDEDAVQRVVELAEKFRRDIQSVIVIGIGGSDLGARAAFMALTHPYHNIDPAQRRGLPQLFFVGDTTDPQPLLAVTEVVDWRSTLIVMISKSGNTIEQMSAFVYLRDQMGAAVGVDGAKQRIVAITDAEKGTLRELVNQEGYASLVIPDAAGGRFSVLSAVGLFPLALAGVDVRELLRGAKDLEEADNAAVSDAATYAYHHWLAYTLRDQSINVLFSYVYQLGEFGRWYRQLWAESLGKKENREGESVHTGPTPIACVGPTDQHSQVQLYMEGPNDKLFTFLRSREAERDIILPKAFPNVEGVAYLAGHSLHKILQAEQEATMEALASAGRPSVLLEIERLDAYHLGQLFYFFELATAYAGEFWNVNAYDQPGVELGKQLMYRKLGRTGY